MASNNADMEGISGQKCYRPGTKWERGSFAKKTDTVLAMLLAVTSPGLRSLEVKETAATAKGAGPVL